MYRPYIFTPPTTNPGFLEIYKNPIAGTNAKYPRYGRYFLFIFFDIMTNSVLIQYNKNK